MAVAKVHGVVVAGVHGDLVIVEVDVSPGLPGMGLVGLPDASVSEAKSRARCAVASAGRRWPDRRITVNLSPAEVRKQGPGLDLPIAVGVLAADGQVPATHLSDVVLLGELGLEGAVRPARGVVAGALAARRQGLTTLVLPRGNAQELSRVDGIRVLVADRLTDVIELLALDDLGQASPWVPRLSKAPTSIGPDLRDVRGQHRGRLAVEVAAAGGHHVALVGPPGIGKTMLATAMPGLLPDLSDDTALEVAVLHSVAAEPRPEGSYFRPPLRMPHHSASAASVLGSVRAGRVSPGAVTLAHRGVLVLDEAPEFSRPVLEGLRQPLEAGTVTVDRAGWSGLLPARFQVILTANPCPCGGRAGSGAGCTCAGAAIRRYAARLSAPLMDRIDIRVAVERPREGDLACDAEPSSVVADRVRMARERAERRLDGTPWTCTADVPPPELRRRWPLLGDGARALAEYERRSPNLRGVDRVLRLAWTVADLAGRDAPCGDDVAMAAALRGVHLGWQA